MYHTIQILGIIVTSQNKHNQVRQNNCECRRANYWRGCFTKRNLRTIMLCVIKRQISYSDWALGSWACKTSHRCVLCTVLKSESHLITDYLWNTHVVHGTGLDTIGSRREVLRACGNQANLLLSSVVLTPWFLMVPLLVFPECRQQKSFCTGWQLTLSSTAAEISHVSRDHLGNTNDRKLGTIIFFLETWCPPGLFFISKF